jgi:hypothetical protein
VQLGVFVLLTIILFFLPMPGWSLWTCAVQGIWITWGSITFLILIVGSVWICGLHYLYKKEQEVFGGEVQVVFVHAKTLGPFISVIIDIAPGLCQALVTILVMFLFSGLYGGKISTALIRAVAVVGFLIISRGICLFFSKLLIDANNDNFITYEDKQQRDTIRMWFETKMNSQSSLPASQGIPHITLVLAREILC